MPMAWHLIEPNVDKVPEIVDNSLGMCTSSDWLRKFSHHQLLSTIAVDKLSTTSQEWG